MSRQRKIYPLSIRDIAPGPGAIRITGIRDDGLPDGYHTGGAWEWGGYIWKPLDGRPYPNAECHIETDEAICLEELAGLPLFPRNWWAEERNGRRFIVRKKAAIIAVSGQELTWKDFADLQVIEDGIRAMNAHNWEINDPILIGIDLETYTPFIVDLSIAGRVNPACCGGADDFWRVERAYDLIGPQAQAIIRRRRSGRHAVDAAWEKIGNKRVHAYGSYLRPFSTLWADYFRADHFVLIDQKRDAKKEIPHTYIFSDVELSKEVLDKWELTWCWSPIQHLPWKE